MVDFSKMLEKRQERLSSIKAPEWDGIIDEPKKGKPFVLKAEPKQQTDTRWIIENVPAARPERVSNLNDDQKRAHDEIINLIEKKTKAASLKGYAGTGKTYLAGELAQTFKDMGYPVYAVAPTHKATHVLGSKLPVDTTTIYSFLGLTLKPDNSGGYKLIRKNGFEVPTSGVVLCDESSMIGEDLHGHTEDTRLQWVFIGDSAQLPPVNEKPSPVLSYIGPTLNRIVRQAEGNPIIELATTIRNGGPIALTSKVVDGTGIAVTRDSKQFLSGLIDRFRADTDCKVLAYRNETVNTYNDAIRGALFGKDLPRFVAGDRIIAKETFFEMGAPVIRNSVEMKIVSATESLFESENHGPWLCWMIEASMMDDPLTVRAFPVLHEKDRDRFYRELKKLEKECRADIRDWRDFYELREMFAQIEYSYALTVHKSQGSTFHTVYVDWRDVSTCKKDERRACQYVAVTRPSNRLAIVA